jgi:hypothetical protein
MCEDKVTLELELAKLYAELEDLQKALPAHTIRPHQIIAIEGVEDKIKEIERKLKE